MTAGYEEPGLVGVSLPEGSDLTAGDRRRAGTGSAVGVAGRPSFKERTRRDGQK